MQYAVLAVLALPLHALALDVPAGAEMQIRLKTNASTQSSKPHDKVEAIVLAPVMVGEQFAIPAGTPLHGEVVKAIESAKGDERSALVLSFSELEIAGAKVPISTQLSGVDNARETVDAQGQINGILASETITGLLDSGIEKLSQKYAGFADILRQAKGAVVKPAENGITYEAGVEMTLKLTSSLHLDGPSTPAADAQPGSIPNLDALTSLVEQEPFRTVAQKPPKPSDITNILLIGSAEQIERAFTDAGWAAASSLSGRAKFETFRALVEARGYKEAPVSVLLLDGKPPDLVFEKLNNTFAQRHHLRAWQRPATFLGQPVWAVAATHDTGISFSEQDRTFIHKIDSNIDAERGKVVADLLFTGRVQGIALVERPKVPQHGQNATGDSLDTDGSMAALLLK
ncbi:MAG: hypothetical protein C5B51_29655 [Terriglobia bacterium]|nr:MAG: hypothetical protein C5B51_29655 [Terriglobia bacterium]